MGQGTSRAASATARSYQAVEATAAAAHSVPAAAGSAVASDAQRAAAAAAAALRTTPTLAEEEELEAQDEQLGSLLDRLGGSVHGRAVAIGPNEVRWCAVLSTLQHHSQKRTGRHCTLRLPPMPLLLLPLSCHYTQPHKLCVSEPPAPLPRLPLLTLLQGPAPATTTGAGRLPPSALRELFELQRAAAGGAVDVERLLAKCVIATWHSCCHAPPCLHSTALHATTHSHSPTS